MESKTWEGSRTWFSVKTCGEVKRKKRKGKKLKRWSTNWRYCKLKSTNYHKSNQNLVFEERGKPEYSGKTFWSRVENQQTQPIHDTESGNRTQATLLGARGECSHNCASPAPLKPQPRLTDYQSLCSWYATSYNVIIGNYSQYLTNCHACKYDFETFL